MSGAQTAWIDRWSSDVADVANPGIVQDGYMPSSELTPMEATGSNGRLLIHTWHKGMLFAGYELLISSALVTQHLKHTKLVIWMDELWAESKDDTKREIVKKFRYTPYGFVEFRLLSPADLASKSSSCWKNRPEFTLAYPFISFGSIAFFSDVVRILLLDVYGGVWIDSDTTVLVDFQVMHRKAWGKVVSGRHFGATEHFGNNNFLYVADQKQRELVADISCEFRFRPLQIPRLNYTEEELQTINFKNEWGLVRDVPIMANGTKMSPYNSWLWNDGVFALCWNLKGLCNSHTLPIATTDALWFGVGGLMDFCELVVGDYGFYVPSVEEVIKSTRTDARNISAYWNAQDLQDLTWVAHDRKKDCRTFGGEVRGTLGVFKTLIDFRLGRDPSLAPIEPLDFLYADPWMLKSRHLHDTDFSQLSVVIESHYSNVMQRRLIRSLANSHVVWKAKKEWDARPKNSVVVRVRFVVEVPDVPSDATPDSAKEIRKRIGLLISEAAQSGDLLLVPPTNRNEPRPPPPADGNKQKIAHYQWGQEEGFLMFPNLTLYEKWGKDSILHSVELPPIELPVDQEFHQPMLDVDVEDQEELTFDSWGEREFKGDGFVSPSMELALMKWSLTSESLYLLLLNDDNVFFNIAKVVDVITKITGVSIFDKTANIPSFVVALPTKETDTTVIAEGLNSTREEFKTKHQSDIPLNKLIEEYDVIVSNKTLRDSNQFSGMLVTRDVVPYLLSSDNPIKKSSKVSFHLCQDNSTLTNPFPNLMAAEYIPQEPAISYSGSSHLHTCLQGRTHPLNSRLDFNKKEIFNQQAFMSYKHPDHIRILMPDSFGFVSMAFSQSLASPLSSATGSVNLQKCFSQWENSSNSNQEDVRQMRDLITRSLVISNLPEACPEVVRPIELIANGYIR